jgi:hypothetical protein
MFYGGFGVVSNHLPATRLSVARRDGIGERSSKRGSMPPTMKHAKNFPKNKNAKMLNLTETEVAPWKAFSR